MSRITKQIANAVANQLVLPKRQDVQNQENKLKGIATGIYLKSIPTEVMQQFEKYPSYFKKRISFELKEHGFNYERFSLEKNLPENSENYYIQVTAGDSSILRIEKDKVQDMTDELNRLRLDIENAIFNLRTYNNVEKEFPEAFKLLPKQQTTALIVNLKDIRCKLDKANC